METFKSSKIFWTYISAIYLQKDAKRSVKVWSVLMNSVHVINLAICDYGSVISLVYDRHELSVPLIVMIYLQIFANTFIIVNYLFYCNRKSKLLELTESLQQTVNQRYNAGTDAIYKRAERIAEISWKLPEASYLIIFDCVFIIELLCLYIYSRVQGEIDVNKWPNLIQIRYFWSL